jgi:hypothetical protein
MQSSTGALIAAVDREENAPSDLLDRIHASSIDSSLSFHPRTPLISIISAVLAAIGNEK